MMDNIENLQWFYHAEGNANIILKNEQCCMALRLQKVLSETELCRKPYEKITSMLPVEKQLQFVDFIVKPFFKERAHYLNDCAIELVSQTFIERVVASIEKERPKKRKNKTISLVKQHVLVMPFLGKFNCQENLASVDAVFFSVELKPKWGFLPKSKHIIPAHNVKKHICRFCLHQSLKVTSGQVGERSNYCPLDLYGSCICRVKHALRSLLETPQNNFAVSVNGQRVCLNRLESVFLGQDRPHPNTCNEFVEVVACVLRHDSMHCPPSSSQQNSDICGNSCFTTHESQCKGMGTSGILCLLKKFQCFDDMDIEYFAESQYETQNVNNSGILGDFENYQGLLWQTFVKQFHESVNQPLDIDDVNMSMRKYLLSQTFKDCSIIITFAMIPKEEVSSETTAKQIIDTHLGRFLYQIKLVDLDPRLVENIPYYYHLDHRIVSSYIEEKTGTMCCLKE